mgnify:CR=1 FL=1
MTNPEEKDSEKKDSHVGDFPAIKSQDLFEAVKYAILSKAKEWKNNLQDLSMTVNDEFGKKKEYLLNEEMTVDIQPVDNDRVKLRQRLLDSVKDAKAIELAEKNKEEIWTSVTIAVAIGAIATLGYKKKAKKSETS